jgi:hypothetical protein
MLSRELGDFLVELSIAMHKHAIYPPGHPLLEGAVDAVARKLWGLLADRTALSIGVARKQLIIEGVATDPNHPLLQELAQKLHRHHLGAVKFTRGVERGELAEMLATVAVDAGRMAQPLGLVTDELARRWDHVRVFSLTYDRLELLDEEKPKENQMAAGRAAQLWVGLARAALAADAASSDDSTPLEPVVVAKAIDEHQREQAYDQIIVGYMLQIASELKAGDAGAAPGESAALQSRISRMVGALRPETLSRLLEMGGDVAQRRRFLLDATQGMTVEAIVDLVKAAATAEKQTVSHSMMRLLSKLAKHAEAGSEINRASADRSVREAVNRLIGEWSLDDPNPQAYRAVLDQVSRTTAPHLGAAFDTSALECEPERIVEMALEIGAVGATLCRAVDRVEQEGKIGLLLDLIDSAPNREAAAGVLDHLAKQETLRRLLLADRVDFSAVERLVRHQGVAAVPALLAAAEEASEPKVRDRLYDLIAANGQAAVAPVAARLTESDANGGPASLQRDLLALLGRLCPGENGVPPTIDLRRYLRHADTHVRREAVKLLLRGPRRDEALLAGLADSDSRIVYLALTAAHERCPREGISLIRGRVERGELDASLRALGIRAAATIRTPETLRWLMARAVTRMKFIGRLRLLPTTPETLAALTAIIAGWRQDPAAATVIQLATKSRDARVRALLRV